MEIYDNDYFDVDDSNLYSTRGSYINSHLASPITLDDCNFLLKYNTFFCKRHIKLKEKMEELEISENIYNICPDPYNCLFNFIKQEEFRNGLKLYQKLLRTSKQGYLLQLINYLENSLSSVQEHNLNIDIDFIYEELISDKKLLYHFEIMKKVEIIKEIICLSKITFGELITHRSLQVERDIFFFNCDLHGNSIGPTNLLLCVLDIYQSRFSLLLYAKISDLRNKYPKQLYYYINKLIIVFEDLRLKLKNNFYSFMSNWESLIIGYAINDPINDLGFSKLFDTTLLQAKDLLKSCNLPFDSILLPPTRLKDDIKLYIELTGLIKHFGHPYLLISDGFDNVRLHGTEKVNINSTIVNQAVGIFNRDFIKEYYNKKRKWPALSYCPEQFLKPYNRNVYPGRLFEYDYKAWALIKFDKIFEYDYSPDTTELLKDSAAANDMDQWFVSYDHCAFRHLYGKSKPKLFNKVKPTRIIERYLVGSEHDLKRKIFELENNYHDDLDTSAILCRKEQELKVGGRLFVKQTYNQRLVQTSMEHNIAKQIMRYIPEQTMTNGEIQQMRRLLDAAKKQSMELEIFNLDLSKWNLRFRHALVYPFGVKFDQMFGLKNLFKNNHYWFLRANVFNNSRLFPPDYDSQNNPIDGPYFYNGHLGGMEGMRQKMWTIITIALIKLSAERSNLSIDIMCQGDNQVVMIRYKPSQVRNKEKIREQFLLDLNNTLNQVNLSLKLEETWFSIKLCEFGKIRYFDGESISAGIKKVYRLVPDINDGVCSILSSLSTINTITESLAKYDYTPDSAFIINQFHILNYLERKKVINTDDTDNNWVQFLFHPSDFGGITLSNYQSHFVRGHDDKISLWLGIFLTLKRKSPDIFRKVISINQFEKRLGKINLRRLIEDIFSLNIQSLPSIENFFKNMALNHITSSAVTNTEITNLFKKETSIPIESLIEQLITMRPMILSIAHEILRNSNAGIILSLRNKFSNVQTINKIVQTEYNKDFLDMMKQNNIKLIKILKIKKQNIESSYAIRLFELNTCPTFLARYLRKEHWDLDMLGETRSNPLHQFKLKAVDHCTQYELENSIIIQLSGTYTHTRLTSYLKDGPYIAYIGAATKEKVKKPSLDISAKTGYVKAYQQLVLLKTWLMRLNCINLVALLNGLLKEKQIEILEDPDLEDEDWCAQNYGGNILHRFRSIIERNSAVINFLPTSATHFKQSTNQLAGITAGGRDFTIYFQLNLLYNIARIIKLKEYNFPFPQLASILNCPHCTIEITEVKFDISEHPSFIPLPILLTPQDIIKENNFSYSELRNFISIYLGRLFGRSCDVIFNKHHIDNKVNISTISSPFLTNVSINDFRYLNISEFCTGIIQGSKTIKLLVLKMSDIELLLSNFSCFEPLAMFVLNSNMLSHFLINFRIRGFEHHHLTDSKYISHILFLGFMNYISRTKLDIIRNLINFSFNDDKLQMKMDNIIWSLKWMKSNIDDFDIEITILDKWLSLTMTQRTYNIILKKLKSRLIMSENRSKLISCESVILKFRNFKNKPDPTIYVGPIFPIVAKKKESIKFDDYIQIYKLFWSKVDQIANNPPLLEIKDFFHYYRQFGNISTAINKIYEILYVLGILKIQIENIHCLAEGSGSIVEGLGRIYPESQLFYNTLILPEIDLRHGADQCMPPAVINSPYVSQNRLRKNNLSLGITDITSNIFFYKFTSLLKSLNQSSNLITIDAESIEGSNNFAIIDKYLKLLDKADINITVMIIKYYRQNMTLYPISENKNYSIFHFKPLMSNPCNQELYLIVVRKNLIKDNIINLLNRYHEALPIAKGFPLLEPIIKSYLTDINGVIDIMIKDQNNLDSIYDIFQTLELKDCNIFCLNFASKLIKTIYHLEKFGLTDYHLTLLIRDGGIDLNLLRLYKIFLVILIGTVTNNVFDFLRLINKKSILRLHRFKDFSQDELGLTNLYDLKTIIRRFHNKEFCYCTSNFDQDLLKFPSLCRNLNVMFKVIKRDFYTRAGDQI